VRLRGRSPEELADFVVSLLLDFETGVGDYARAFAAPDSSRAARIIDESIGRWRSVYHHDTYHQSAAAALRLEWTLNAIQLCVLPHDPLAAFTLIVRFFENDDWLGPDDLDHLSDVFQRAGILFRKIAAACNSELVERESERLLKHDRTGYRAWLKVDDTGKPAWH